MENTDNTYNTNFDNLNGNQYEPEYEYIPEYSKDHRKYNTNYNPSFISSLNYKKRPTNSLDYMKFQSEDYLRYKIENKVRDRIKELNLGNKLETQIFEIVFNFYKKFKEKSEKIRLFDLIPIVTFKVIKHDRIPISNKTAIEKLKLDKSKFLKFSNRIQIENEGVVFKIEGEEFMNKNEKNLLDEEKIFNTKTSDFNEKVFDYVQFIIQKLSEFYKNHPNAFKLKNSEKLIDFYFTKFDKIETIQSKGNFFDFSKFLEEIKKEAKFLINGQIDLNTSQIHFNQFNEYFCNKLLVEHLAAAIVKKLSDIKGVKINLQTFKDLFDIPISGISRGNKMINEYYKFINKACKKE